MKKLIFIIWSFLLFCTCAETEKPVFDAPSRNLESTIMMDRDSAMIIGKTNFITMVHNSLYISDKYDEYCYTEYNTKTREYLRFCRHGQGPGEMVNPMSHVSSITINDTAYLGIFDVGSRRICLFEENASLGNKKTYKKVIPFGSNSIHDFTLDIFMLNDSILLSDGAFDGYICKIYKNMQPQEKYMKVFTKKGEATDFRQAMADCNKIDLSPDKLHVVRATQCGGLIEAYRIAGVELQPMFRREYFDVAVNDDLKGTDDSKYGYIDITVSNKKIYALYSGGFIHARDENNIQTTFQSKTVHVYDMEGNELETLLLDKYVSAIAVKADDSELYALSTEEKDLLQYKLD